MPLSESKLMATCGVCGASIPAVLGTCVECESETGWVDYPTRTEWWDEEYARELMNKAESDRITFERLTTRKSNFVSRLLSEDDLLKHRTQDRPIIGYLSKGETPHYVFVANKSIVFRDRQESRYLREEQSGAAFLEEGGYRPLIVVTDQRILIILGDSSGDSLASARIENLVDIDATFSRPSDQVWDFGDERNAKQRYDIVYKIHITTVDSKVELYINPEHEAAEINSAVQFLADLTVTSDELETLQRSSDGIQTEVDSTDRATSSAGQSTSTTEDSGPVSASTLADLRSMRENVDWQASVETGFRVGSKSLSYAAMTSYSTPVLVGATTLTGTVLKAHHMATGEPPTGSIDPDELLDRGLAGADFGDRFEIPEYDERRAGASIGTARYLAERITPESYKHWVLRTDPETILKGAQMGSRLSKQAQVPFTPKQGTIAGACAGLVYSYVPEDSALKEVDPEALFEDTNFSHLDQLLGE